MATPRSRSLRARSRARPVSRSRATSSAATGATTTRGPPRVTSARRRNYAGIIGPRPLPRARRVNEAESPAPAGRRPRRQRERAHAAAPAFLRRRIPAYTLLEPEGLDRIQQQAEQLLAEIGVEFRGDEAALDLWRRAGARVDGVRVRFEPGQVVELIASAPACFTQHARDPAHSVEIGGDAVVFAPAYGSPFVLDREKGRRYGS